MSEWKVRISPKPGSGQCQSKEVTVNATSQQDARETVKGMYSTYQPVSAPQRVEEQISHNQQPRPNHQFNSSYSQPSNSAYSQPSNSAYSQPSNSSYSPSSGGYYDDGPVIKTLATIAYVLPAGLIVAAVLGVVGIVAVQNFDQKLCNPECQVTRQTLLKKVNIDFPINLPPKPQAKEVEPKVMPVFEQRAEEARELVEEQVRVQAQEEKKEEMRQANLKYHQEQAQEQAERLQKSQEAQARNLAAKNHPLGYIPHDEPTPVPEPKADLSQPGTYTWGEPIQN